MRWRTPVLALAHACGVGVKFPARRLKIPARFLLGAKKFPARPRRELLLSTLKSKVFSAHVFPKRAEFPANSLPAGDFSLARTPPIQSLPNGRGVRAVPACPISQIARTGLFRRGSRVGAIRPGGRLLA